MLLISLEELEDSFVQNVSSPRGMEVTEGFPPPRSLLPELGQGGAPISAPYTWESGGQLEGVGQALKYQRTQ